MFVLIVIALASLSYPMLGDEPNRAGLVVQFADGDAEKRCIVLEGANITGADLLEYSGLTVVADTSSGMGITICQIEGVGCAYPAEHCFCRCRGGEECAYWNYFYRDPGEIEWTYSAMGAVLHKIKPGSVEAWVWGDGRTPPTDDLTFEAICTPTRPTPTETAARPTPAATTATTRFARLLSPSQAPTATTITPWPTAQILSPAPFTKASRPLAGYWPFGLMVLGIVLIGAIARLRRPRSGD